MKNLISHRICPAINPIIEAVNEINTFSVIRYARIPAKNKSAKE